MNKFIAQVVEKGVTILSWVLLTSPFWASFVFPTIIVYFILVFDLYFFYKAASLGINSIRAYMRLRQTVKVDWFEKLKSENLDYSKIIHVVLLPTYKEPIEILERTLLFLTQQEFPPKQILVVLAGEKREEAFAEKASVLKKAFSQYFYDLTSTIHTLEEGEIAGKSSNMRYAAIETQKLIEARELNKDFVTFTSCDADVSIHPKYFSRLTYLFLTNPDRYERFWQGALVFYNNIWRVPLPVKVVHTLYSMASLADLMRVKSGFLFSSYSGSWRLLEKAKFWDPDVISEDWHLFFKAFFATNGEVEVEAIFLPLLADAVEGKSYWSSLTAQYDQNRRWAWGITDIGYAVYEFLENRKRVSLPNFILRFIKAVEQHLLWPVNWWVITLGATLPPLLNPTFRYTAQGFYLPRLSGLIMTFGLVFVIILIIVDWQLRPPRPADVKRGATFLSIIQYILLPITGFFFSSLPGMDAHTRVLLGKRLDYKVTEKIAKK